MERWNDAILNEARQRMDPEADALIRQLFAAGAVDNANQIFRSLQHNASGIPDNAPPFLQDWLRETDRLPSWYDHQKALAGQRLFQRHGMSVVMVLFNRALPETYLGAKGVQVLYRTHQLTKDPTRRILETAQLVFDVCEPGGFEAGGQAVRTCQKVRLVHAGVRYLLLHHPEIWNSSAWDQPINQEDAAGTIQAFAALTLQTLERMGLDFSAEERQGYMHIWKVAGYFLGVEERFLTDEYEEGLQLIALIERRQFRKTPEAITLVKALLSAEAELVPGKLLDFSIPAIMRWMVGEHYAEMLELPKTPGANLLMSALRLVEEVTDDLGDEVGIVRRMAAKFNRSLMRGLYEYNLKHRKVEFRISQHLSKEWGLT